MQDQYDVKNPMDTQVLHLGVEEETSRFCSWRLHVLLDAVSAGGKKYEIFSFINKKGVSEVRSTYLILTSNPKSSGTTCIPSYRTKY